MKIKETFLALRAAVLLGALLITVSHLGATDNSQLGFTSNRNNVASSSDVPVTWTSGKLEKCVFWTHDTLSEICASPLIVGDCVIVASEDGIISVFMLSASPQVAMHQAHRGRAPIVHWELDGPIHATPRVSKGILYVTTQRKLYALRLGEKSAPPEIAPALNAAATTAK